jgi:hypothetical protein
MFSFKNDLGIIPNEGTPFENDVNLAQGQQFMEYGRIYSSAIKPHLYKLQLTTSPALQSITEALQGDDSIISANAASKTSISTAENEFNKTMTEYSQAFNELNKELLAANNHKSLQKYFNNIVTVDDQNFTYVNNYGYTHKYSNDSWQNKDKSCNSKVLNPTAAELAALNKNSGPAMSIGQMCNIAGQNIQNVKTNEIAWVDVKGFKHSYSNDIWSKKNSACSSDVKILDENSYDLIPSGSPMTETSNCHTLIKIINPEIIERLVNINKKLINHAENINSETNNIKVNDDSIKNDLSNERKKIKKYINHLKEDNHRFNAYKNSDSDIYNTLIGQDEISRLTLNSNYFHYLIWILLILTFLLIALHAITNDSFDGVIVIIGLVLLYSVVKYIYNWA